MKGWLNRIMGRSVTDLAKEVDQAKGLLDQAQGRLAEQLGKVAAEEENVRLAQIDYDAACAALVEEHPHLIGRMVNAVKKDLRSLPAREDYEMLTNPSAWDPEPIEVDDENDPRWTEGVALTSPSDDEPIGSIEFGVREGHDE